MKKYIKPEIEIVEFDIFDAVVTDGSDIWVVPPVNEDEWDPNSAEVFYGIEAGEEGYLIHN